MFEPIYYREYSYGCNNKIGKTVETGKPGKPVETVETGKTVETVETREPVVVSMDKSIVDKPIQYILNPLTVIIKLAILSCKPIGTKIHIQNNVIYFQEPGIFQSLARYIFNSNKSHLQYIYIPIQIACQTYLSKKFMENTPNIVNLFISAKNGIENLMKTYSVCPITILCLKYYHVILSNYISGLGGEPVMDMELYTKEILQKFEQQWNDVSKLKIIIDLMDFLSNHGNKTTNIQSLETIIQTIDEDTQKNIFLLKN